MRTARFNGHLSGSRTVGRHRPEADTPTPMDPEADPPPHWTEWQTGVKTLPFPQLRLQAVIKGLPVYVKYADMKQQILSNYRSIVHKGLVAFYGKI